MQKLTDVWIFTKAVIPNCNCNTYGAPRLLSGSRSLFFINGVFMDIAKGIAIIVGVVGVFFFLRWMMKPDPKLKASAKEFNKSYHGYPTEEQQKPIYPSPGFKEGDVQHRPRVNPVPRPTTPPPAPRPAPQPTSRDRARRSAGHYMTGSDAPVHRGSGDDSGLTAGILLGVTIADSGNASATSGSGSRSSGDGYSHHHVDHSPTRSSSSDNDYSPSDNSGGGGGSDD